MFETINESHLGLGNKLSDLKIGEWTPLIEGGYSIRLNKNSFYSSNEQDTIILLEYLIRIEKQLKSLNKRK